MNIFKLLCLICSIVFLCAAPVQAKNEKNLKIVYVEWDCATASSYLAKEVLEKHLGYTVELIPVSLPILWASLASGDADAMLTAWLPYTNADMYAKVKDKVDILGKITDGARLGLVVPDYVTITSVTQLNEHADKFQGQIVGIDPGAAIMGLTEKLLKEYDIKKLELMEGSGAIMASSLEDALRKQQWIVVTGWSPHWMFGRWKLRYLDDPRKTLGENEGIYTIARKNLARDYPEAATFLARFAYTDTEQLQKLMAWNQEKGASPTASARRFMKEYSQQVEAWLKP